MPVDLNRLYHVNITVADLDRSVTFYEALGFRVTARHRNDGERKGTARALGGEFNPVEFAFMRLGNGPNKMLIDLCQYFDPPTYGTPVQDLHHAGMVRLAFHVDEIEPVYDELKAMGVRMLGPLEFATPPGGGRSAVFAFHDPDGTILEVLSGVEHMAE